MKNQGKFQEVEGGGGYDKYPLEWKIQGMGSKGYEYFLELHNNLSYF